MRDRLDTLPDVAEAMEYERHREGPPAGVTYLAQCRFCTAAAITACELCEAPLCEDDISTPAEASVLMCPDCAI